MKTLPLLVIFWFSFFGFSQSKNEQMIILTSRIDSLESVVLYQYNQLTLKTNEIERLKMVVSTSDVKIELLNQKIDSLERIADSIRLKEDISRLYSGEWCNADNWESSGEYFNITINVNPNGEGHATYTQGGPFEEEYKFKITEEGKLELYWEGISGSIAFDENNKSNETCKKITALLKIMDNNTLEVMRYVNDCAYLSRNITLKKLNENESCMP